MYMYFMLLKFKKYMKMLRVSFRVSDCCVLLWVQHVDIDVYSNVSLCFDPYMY